MTSAVALNAPTSFFTPSLPECKVESNPKFDRADIARGWAQVALIVSSIATAVILSSAGILPAAVLTVAKIGCISTAVSTVLVIMISTVFGRTEEKESKFRDKLKKITPFEVAVGGPVTEELIFRGILQGGLQWGLKRALPAAVMSVLGIQLPVASVVAAVVAGTVFGLVHLTNDHKGNKVQALNATLGGIFVEGGVFAVYGLWASCLTHIINNTFVATIMQAAKSAQAQTHTPDA